MQVIGIDLGTTNSEVAVWQDGQPRLLDIEGSCLVPSVVAIDDAGEVLVGQAAVNQELVAPDRTIRWVKRLMGTGKSIELGGRVWSPAMVSSRILAYLKAAAERHLGAPVEGAVITVPAFFDEQAREDTRTAAELAGLPLLRLINEPTAAAVAYAMGRKQEERWLVYDLGGGTFDVSVVDSSDGVMEVLASHGDTRLGGHDIDHLLANVAASDYTAEHDLDLNQPGLWPRVMRAAEAVKIALSTAGRSRMREEYLLKQDGIDHHLDLPIDRSQLEALTAPLLDRTLQSVRIALREANCTAASIDRVVLVGGATRAPQVAELLRTELGCEPQAWLDPDRVVARGAVVEAAALSGATLTSNLIDITPHSLGTEAMGEGGQLDTVILIRRNSPLPCVCSRLFYKAHPGQDRIDVMVLQGESADPTCNRRIGEFSLTGLAASPDPEVHARFELDRSGLLQVSVEHLETGISHVEKIDQVVVQRSVDAGELPAVRLDDTAITVEAPEVVAEVMPAEAASAVADEGHDDLHNRAALLLADTDLDDEDRADLEAALAAVDADEAGADARLADLVYFLE